VTLSDGVRVTAAEGVREAVFAGLGLAVGTEWMFQPELQSGRVKEVLGDWTLPPIDLWAVFPSGTTGERQSPCIRRLRRGRPRGKQDGFGVT
jgi:DNA-binding transcriptional LysR family regulator